MANTKSIQKIKDYLQNTNRVVSISDISSGASLKMKSIRECLDFLEQTNQIFIMRSSGTTLVQLKKLEVKQ